MGKAAASKKDNRIARLVEEQMELARELSRVRMVVLNAAARLEADGIGRGIWELDGLRRLAREWGA